MLDKTTLTTKLNTLIQTNLDGKTGYEEAAQNVDDPVVTNAFEQYSDMRNRFARELSDILENMGGTPPTGGTILGAVHRGWINLKSIFTESGEQAMLEECVRGEDMAITDYEETLRLELPDDVRMIIENQLKEIRAVKDHIESMLKVVEQ